MSRRKITKRKITVARQRRVYRTITVTKIVLQCERPYVLFGNAVSAARIKANMTQQELADKLGYSRGSIANIETGRQRILLTDVFSFAKALRLKPQAMFKAVQQ